MKSWQKIPYLSVLVCASALLLFFLGEEQGRAWRLFRHSELFRLVPSLWWSMLAHTGAAHLWFNVGAGILVLGSLELYSRRLWLACVLVSAPLSALAVFWFMPGLRDYCGLSSVLHAAAAALGVCLWRKGKWEAGVILLLLIPFKVSLEFFAPNGTLSGALEAGVRGTPLGHWVGFLCGLLLALFLCRRPNRGKR